MIKLVSANDSIMSCNGCHNETSFYELSVGTNNTYQTIRFGINCLSELKTKMEMIHPGEKIEIYCVNCGQKFLWDLSMLRLCDDCVSEENTNPAA